MEINEVVVLYLGWAEKRVAATTFKDLRQRLKRVAAATKGNTMQVPGYICNLDLSPKSVNNYLSVWRVFTRWAHERQLVSSQLVHELHAIPFHRVFPRPPRAYSVQEFSEVATRIRVEQVRDLCIFLVSTGLRISEAFATTWADVDLVNGLLEVHGTKTLAAHRTVATGRFGRVALKRQLSRSIVRAPGSLIWPFSPKYSRTRWRSAHPSWVPYRPQRALRHTFTTWALAAGENVLWVRNQLGHTTLEMISKRYGQLLGPSGGGALDRTVSEAVHAQLSLFHVEEGGIHA